MRAVHLDVVPDLSTQTFIRSLKRFCARRGLPRKIVSDNAKTFKAAARKIKAVMDHEEVQRYLSGVGIEWSFNIERAPWWGGVFERMVKSTKRCLKKMIGQAKFSYDELLTAVTEVEMIVNSRPLSYVSADDLEEPLTPSHLLIGRRVLTLPDGLCYKKEIDDDTDTSPAHLSRRMRHLNDVLNRFWKRWRNEYLLELRECHRYRKESTATVSVSVGDVVVVHSDNMPRGFWRLARVESTIVGRDGHTRGAVLRLSTKGGRTTMLQRPIQRLYPLEINCHKRDSEGGEMGTADTGRSEDSADVIKSRRPPRRAAALRASDRIKACALELTHD